MLHRSLALLVLGMLTAATTIANAADRPSDRGRRGGGDSRPSVSRPSPSSPSRPAPASRSSGSGRDSGPRSFSRPQGSGSRERSAGPSINLPKFQPPASRSPQPSPRSNGSGGSLPSRVEAFRQQNRQVTPPAASRPQPAPARPETPRFDRGGSEAPRTIETPRPQIPQQRPNPGNPGNSGNGGADLRQRLEQFRGQSPGTRGPEIRGQNPGDNRPSFPGTRPPQAGTQNPQPRSPGQSGQSGVNLPRPNAGNGNSSATERLRERFQQQNGNRSGNRPEARPEQPRPEQPTPGPTGPQLPNLERFREQLESRQPNRDRPELNRSGSNRPDFNRPGSENRPGGDNSGRDGSGRDDVERLRERFRGQSPGGMRRGDEDRDDPRLPGIGERGPRGDDSPRGGDGPRGRDDLPGRGEDRGPGNDRGPDRDRGPGSNRGPGVDRGPGNNRGPETDRDRDRPQLPGLGNRDGRDQHRDRESEGARWLDFARRDGDRSGWKLEPQKFDREHAGRTELASRFQHHDRIRNNDDLQKHLDRFQNSPDVREALARTHLKVNDFSGAFQSRIRQQDGFRNIAFSDFGRRHHIDRQFNLFVSGDVTRRLGLNQQLIHNGGWSKRVTGPIFPRYTSIHFSSWYPGPSWYPRYCWTPRWSPWVRWTFWDYCRPIYDPRPFLCRPVYYYDPCPPIVYYDYPVWQPLPVVSCGTWVDVPVVVAPTGYDLQLLAVRFVDPGHPEENLGPRYRVWLRNNSPNPVRTPFNVTLVAANDQNLIPGMPQAGVILDSIEPEAVVPVDIRLPMDANRMNVGADGQRMPFAMLHVLVDSHREIPELDETNNGLMIGRGEILPVDPAAFATEEPTAYPGSMVSLAGEGFGPEPGQLLVLAGNQEFPAEIHGWYDLGVYFKLPNVPMTPDGTVQLLVIRGDGAVSNPVTVSLNPGI